MNLSRSISLIIPHADDYKNLDGLLNSIESWTIKPNEIVVVDSSSTFKDWTPDSEDYFKEKNIKLKIMKAKGAFPGRARNIGIINSSCCLIAFLDCNTVPTNSWLQSSDFLINDSNLYGVWGSTNYECEGYTQEIIRAATYGLNTLETLPGSIIRRECFQIVGLFVPNVRAGEDGDWFQRANLHEIVFHSQSQPQLRYHLKKSVNLKFILSKWYRNNSKASLLKYLKPHKDIYYYSASILAVLIAYNWNNLIAAWDMNSAFYIPNITKITAGILFLSYYFIRAFWMPVKKGTSYKFLLPFNHFLVFILSVLLDLVKLLAFFSSTIIHNLKKINNKDLNK